MKVEYKSVIETQTHTSIGTGKVIFCFYCKELFMSGLFRTHPIHFETRGESKTRTSASDGCGGELLK